MIHQYSVMRVGKAGASLEAKEAFVQQANYWLLHSRRLQTEPTHSIPRPRFRLGLTVREYLRSAKLGGTRQAEARLLYKYLPTQAQTANPQEFQQSSDELAKELLARRRIHTLDQQRVKILTSPN